MKPLFIAGLAISLLGATMAYSPMAQAAAWRKPAEACTPSLIGQFRTTTNDYRPEYIDYATWLCDEEGWVLADVTRCFPLRCVPL